MSFLRRRHLGDTIADGDEHDSRGESNDKNERENNASVNNTNPSHNSDEKAYEDAEDDGGKRAEVYTVVSANRLERLKRPKGTKRRYAWIFILGGLFGLAIAAFFTDNSDILDLTAFTGVHLDSIIEVLPSGFLKGVRDLQVRLFIAICLNGLCGHLQQHPHP